MHDPYQLQRFMDAQNENYANVLAELKAGKKQSHWMWYIFPQIDGLGHSATANFYSIKSLEEAKAYLEHIVLGPRYVECATLVFNTKNRTVEQIFGYPDYLKFCSSLTLFQHVDDSISVISELLIKYYNNKQDALTLELLSMKEKNPHD